MKKCYILRAFGKGQQWIKRGIEGVERVTRRSEATKYSKQEAESLRKIIPCKLQRVSSV